MNIPIKFVEDIGEHHTTAQPGDAEFYISRASPREDKIAGILFMCPCGCGSLLSAPFNSETAGPIWQWDGDKEKPTITPSIRVLDRCKWHGFITKGEFVTV